MAYNLHRFAENPIEMSDESWLVPIETNFPRFWENYQLRSGKQGVHFEVYEEQALLALLAGEFADNQKHSISAFELYVRELKTNKQLQNALRMKERIYITQKQTSGLWLIAFIETLTTVEN